MIILQDEATEEILIGTYGISSGNLSGTSPLNSARIPSGVLLRPVPPRLFSSITQELFLGILQDIHHIFRSGLFRKFSLRLLKGFVLGFLLEFLPGLLQECLYIPSGTPSGQPCFFVKI